MSDPIQARRETRRRRGATGREPVIDAIDMRELAVAGRAAEFDRLKAAIGNARDGATMLQVVRGSLSAVAERLAEMRIIAVQAAGTCPEEERAALDRRFAECRAEIDGAAEAACFRGVRLLCGGTRIEEVVEPVANQRFAPIELGYRLRRESGFTAFLFEPDTPTIEAGDRIRVEYQAEDRRFMVTNMTTGSTAHTELPRHATTPGKPATFKLPELGLTVHLDEAFPFGSDNMADTGAISGNEFRIGMVARKESRTVVTNMLELDFQVGWRGGDQDRIMLRLPSARIADLDRDLATAGLSSAQKARRCLALVRRTALEVSRIGAVLDGTERIFEAASERLAASAEFAHAPEQAKVASLAKVALVRATLGRAGSPLAGLGQRGFLAARSIPAMRHLLLDLACAS